MTASPESGQIIYRRLLSMVARHRLVFGLSILAVVADAGGQAVFVYLIKPLIDDNIGADNGQFSLLLPALAMAAILIRIAGNFGGQFGMEWVGRRLIADLRESLFLRYLTLPARFFDQHTTGQLVSRLTYNTEQVAQAVTKALIGVVRDSLTVVGYITVMLILSWRLTLAMLLLVPVVALVVTVISRRFRKISTRIQDSMGDVTHVTEEAVNGHPVIKVFGGQDQEYTNFDKINENHRRLHLRLRATQLVSSSLIQLAAGMALVLVLLIAGADFMRAQVTPGTFTAVLMAMVASIPPLKRLTAVHMDIQKGIAAADSIFRTIDEPPEEDRGGVAMDRARGALRFENVGFVYPDSEAPVLTDIDLEVPEGTVTALVGRSGSGKSSLVKLLPRFYSPTAGRILLDETDIRNIRLSDLRRQIALVSQDVVLFNDTVARNIAYGGRQEASRQEIQAAAEAAHAMEFIRAMPYGLDTPIGEDGALLSGGQRQRLAIARALLKDAPVLILDEATSALDAESEGKIRDALIHLMKGRTTLVIAHRLSTVEKADQVVVLDQGRIVETGTHQELLDARGLYSHLYQLQFASS